MSYDSIHISYCLLRNFSSQQLNGEEYYPLGISIENSGRQFYLRSRIDEFLKIYRSDLDRLTKKNAELRNFILSGYCSEKLYNEIISNELFPIFNLLEDEKESLYKIIELKGEDYASALTKDNLENDYMKYTSELTEVLDNQIKTAYMNELRGLFYKFTDKEYDKEFFRITNYLIHFVNWENSFYNFYDNSLDLISGVIRKIENHLSGEILTSIKAYRAYHSQINVLTRFLEKREKGRITALSILDWYTDIRQILSDQYKSFFGNRKAKEYITALEKILVTELNK